MSSLSAESRRLLGKEPGRKERKEVQAHPGFGGTARGSEMQKPWDPVGGLGIRLARLPPAKQALGARSQGPSLSSVVTWGHEGLSCQASTAATGGAALKIIGTIQM